MIKKTNANKYGVVEYAVSTEDEIAQLPYLVGQGSVAIVIETGNVFMFNEENSSWHSLVDGKVIVPNGLVPSVVDEVMPLSMPIEKKQVKTQPIEQPMNKAPKKSKKSTKK